MVKKRELSLCAIIVAICFVVSQSLSVYAVTNSTLTSQQLGTIFDGVESIVVQLEGIGLSEADISELFQLTPRENGFYAQTSTQTIPYTGTFVAETVDEPQMSVYSSYNGNLPSSDIVQKERLENIYGVALQYFHSDYYEGSDANGTDFGNYLTYLYLSHYVDGPGRAPTANDLPFIISSSDISAYNTFLNSAHLSSWATEVANLGATIYSNCDYFSSINAINTVDQIIDQGINDATMAAVNGYNTISALSTITPLIKSYIVGHHAIGSDEEELTQGTLDYVSSQLYALNFYENFDEKITNTIISILATTFISAICSSISLIGVCVSVIPLFVYECTSLIQTAVLVNLQYSFSGRYAVRTGIYLGI